MSRALFFAVWVGSLSLLSCTDPSEANSPGINSDGAANDASERDAASQCAGRGESIAWGTERTSEHGAFEVTLLESKPEIPRVGDNVWTLALTHGGKPLPSTELRTSSWMPDHSHGSLKAAIDHEIAPGRHRIEPLSFQMPGLWQVTLAIDGDAGTERAIFTFCVTD
jgi:hypothetical protein